MYKTKLKKNIMKIKPKNILNIWGILFISLLYFNILGIAEKVSLGCPFNHWDPSRFLKHLKVIF